MSFFLSWNATAAGIQIPERKYLTPITLGEILTKHFPHSVSSNSKQASKLAPGPTVLLTLQYTLLFDPEQHSIPPPSPGGIGRVKSLMAEESSNFEIT